MFDFFKKLFGKKCENCKDGVCQCDTQGKCGEGCGCCSAEKSPVKVEDNNSEVKENA